MSQNSSAAPWGSFPWLRLCGFVSYADPSDETPGQQEWNDETSYTLDHEWEDLLQDLLKRQEAEPEEDDDYLPEPVRVANREYYSRLGVSADAEWTELQKDYCKAARKCHPEANPENEESLTQFQQLTHAYQVLSFPETRDYYNKFGKVNEVNPLGNMDPVVFFNVVFGSNSVQPYIGEVASPFVKEDLKCHDSALLSRSQRMERMEDRSKKQQDEMEWERRKRYVTCAKNLKKHLAAYNPYDPEAFQEECREEATALAKTAYGGMYASTVGFALQVAGEEYLGDYTTLFGLGGTMARTRKGANHMTSNFNLMGPGIKAASVSTKSIPVDSISERSTGEPSRTETFEISMPAFLKYAWAKNKREIQTTISEVCRRVLEDADISERVNRARALQIMGREYYLAGRQAMKNPSQQEYFGERYIRARTVRPHGGLKTMQRGGSRELVEPKEDAKVPVEKARVQPRAIVPPTVEAPPTTTATAAGQETHQVPRQAPSRSPQVPRSPQSPRRPRMQKYQTRGKLGLAESKVVTSDPKNRLGSF